jgi:holo-[acyl-carrier protein] synthase
MIVGHGIDIMSTARIEKAIRRFGDRFMHKIYTDHERSIVERRQAYAAQICTSLWAAKEATMKALGTGNRQGVRFRDIEIRHEPTGKPYIVLYGVSKQHAERLNVHNIEVSMSHLDDNAVASVIFEKLHEGEQGNGHKP